MEMADKYNEYDVVVMPTINEEPFGLVALETIAKGIPLITTNSGALLEVVGDGAIIVDKNNFTHGIYGTNEKQWFKKDENEKAPLNYFQQQFLCKTAR